MGKKSRRPRAGAGTRERTPEERAQQVLHLKRRLLDDYQLDDRVPGVDALYAQLDAFARDGASASGTLPLPGSNKRIHYLLSTRAHVDCRVGLQVHDGARGGAGAGAGGGARAGAGGAGVEGARVRADGAASE